MRRLHNAWVYVCVVPALAGVLVLWLSLVLAHGPKAGTQMLRSLFL